MLQRRLTERLTGILIALTLVFGAGPMAHADSRITPEVAAYLAQGGALSDLCLPGDHPDHIGGCPDCVLCQMHALPLPGQTLSIRSSDRATASCALVSGLVSVGIHLQLRVRAPPRLG